MTDHQDKQPARHISAARVLRSTEFLLVLAFFAILLVMGTLIYKDYGLHWDSIAQVDIGQRNYQYVFEHIDTALRFKNRYYGPVFEVFLFAVTREMPQQQMYFARNLLNFLLFYCGVFFFYLLAKKTTGCWKMGLLGSIFLAASPRIFADSFYNSKDIPFLVVFIIAIYTLLRFLENPSWLNGAAHAVASGILVALRMPGIVILFLTAVFLALLIVTPPKSTSRARLVLAGLWYLALSTGLTFLFWPVLWQNPPGELVNAFQFMSSFPWTGGSSLYRGTFVDPMALPWHYIPVWVLITTPLFLIATFLIGAVSGTTGLVHRPREILSTRSRYFLVSLAWLTLPVLAVILLKSTLYDGWRQMYFIYPALLLIALRGVQAVLSLRLSLIHPRLLRGVLILLIVVGLLEPLIFMVQAHPNEYAFFNILAGRDMQAVKQKYELDYWGLSYRPGLEYILAHDPAETIPIYTATSPGRVNALLLTEDQQQRLRYVSSPEVARYFLTTYRWHPQPYDYTDEVFSVKVGDASILSVFQLQP